MKPKVTPSNSLKTCLLTGKCGVHDAYGTHDAVDDLDDAESDFNIH